MKTKTTLTQKRSVYIPDDYSVVETPEELALEIHSNEDRLCVIYFGGKRGKPDDHYRYKTIEKLRTAIENKIKGAQEALEHKAEQKVAVAEKAAKITEGTSQGDVFCYSWGWEQTNVDFYQVVEKKTAKSMIVREISCRTLSEASWASDYVRPEKDAFLVRKDGTYKEETVRLNQWGGFNRSCGSANKIENPEESKHYRSWYA